MKQDFPLLLLSYVALASCIPKIPCRFCISRLSGSGDWMGLGGIEGVRDSRPNDCVI